MFVSSDNIEGICKSGSKLKTIVCLDLLSDELKALTDDAGLTVLQLTDVINKGREATAEVIEPTAEDCFIISYTSGTFGNPKGVMITHRMALQCAAAVQSRLGDAKFTEKDTYISYLPASHSFEQAVFTTSLIYSVKCGFFSGNADELLSDLQVLQPTFFPCVPKFLVYYYNKIQSELKAAPGCKYWFVEKCVNAKLDYLEKEGGTWSYLYDKLIFDYIKQMLGGKVRLMVTGSARISPDILKFLKICFCCDILEGYGMTESFAGSCCSMPGDPETGTIGGPMKNCKVRLREEPNFGFSLEKNKGELCISGCSIMKSYFKEPEKSAEALKDGWLATGDIAEILPNGSIKLIGRLKNLIKLSQGHTISPEILEAIYLQSEHVQQAWVYGDSNREFIIVFCVITPKFIDDLVLQRGKPKQELLAETAVKLIVLLDLIRISEQYGLEKPKNIFLLDEPFSI